MSRELSETVSLVQNINRRAYKIGFNRLTNGDIDRFTGEFKPRLSQLTAAEKTQVLNDILFGLPRFVSSDGRSIP